MKGNDTIVPTGKGWVTGLTGDSVGETGWRRVVLSRGEQSIFARAYHLPDGGM